MAPLRHLADRVLRRYAERDGDAFDIFAVQHTETGRMGEIYFIDLIRKAVAAGRAKQL